MCPKNCSKDITGAKQQSIIVIPMTNRQNAYFILDCLKIADIIIPVFSTRSIDLSNVNLNPKTSGKVIDELGYAIIQLLQTVGIPNVLGAAQHLEEIPQAKQHAVKQVINRYFDSEFGGEGEKLCYIDNNDSSLQKFMRSVCSIFPRPIKWRENRSYFVVNSLRLYEGYQEEEKEEDKGLQKIEVQGFVKGNNSFSTNRIAHVTGYGNFAIESIQVIRGVFQVYKMNDVNVVKIEERNVQTSDECELLKPHDFEEGEKNFALSQQRMDIEEKKASKIQILDDDDDEDDDDDSQKGFQGESDSDQSDQKYEDRSEAITNKHYKQSVLQSRARDQMDFPDEVDTPTLLPARQRFRKYKSLKNFKKSQWDPYENLPFEYSQIFKLQNAVQSEKQSMAQSLAEGLDLNGLHVRMKLRSYGNPEQLKQGLSSHPKQHPIIVSNLFPDQTKISVNHFKIQRHPDSQLISPNGSIYEFHCGFRRYLTRPIFSKLSGDRKKVKMTRFSNPVVDTEEKTVSSPEEFIASIYGPISFANTNVLIFQHHQSHNEYNKQMDIEMKQQNKTNKNKKIEYPIANRQFIASGYCLGSDPQLLIIKRIILTGYPLKVMKKKAVVRYMFFSPQDVKYFQPVQLFTKHKLRGHIRKSLGTHGHMKCIFNNFLKGDDIICMPLYKRCYPKWFELTWNSGDLRCDANKVDHIVSGLLQELEDKKEKRLRSALTQYNLK